MDLYDEFMKPIEKRGLSALRKQQISNAKGHVLELGAGNGANLPYYDFQTVNRLEVTDMKLSKKLVQLQKTNQNAKMSFKEVSVMSLPYVNDTFDTIVFTLMFCSVTDVSKGLSEIKRVLKDHGQIIFIEHVIAPKKPLRSIMHWINTPWKNVAHGCNLNRDFEQSLAESGFVLTEEEHFFMGIGFRGVARKQ